MRPLCPLLLVLTLSACGPLVKADKAEDPPVLTNFAEGQWEITQTIRSPGGRPQTKKDAQVHTKCVKPERAAMEPQQFILSMTGQDRCRDGEARLKVANGSVSGTLTCPGSYDIPDHPERMSGAYTRDSYKVTIELPLYGAKVRVTQAAKRIGDCPDKRRT